MNKKMSVTEALEMITEQLKRGTDDENFDLSKVDTEVAVFGNATIVLHRDEDAKKLNIFVTGGKPMNFSDIDLNIFTSKGEADE